MWLMAKLFIVIIVVYCKLYSMKEEVIFNNLLKPQILQ